MDYSAHKQRLLEMEQRLTARVDVDTATGREQSERLVGDSGDQSVAGQNATLGFTKAEAGSTILTQVRDALTRLDAGTYGACLVDGAPIDAQRLEAAPWVPYCLKHQQLLEAGGLQGAPPTS